MAEVEIERALIKCLRSSDLIARLGIQSTNTSFKDVAELINGLEFDVFQNTSDWNQDKSIMIDVIGGMTPDIVIRSKLSNENRIYIEVKETSSLNFDIYDSQIVRYFLHLLSSTRQRPMGKSDISRAVLLAAPEQWFVNEKNNQAWTYFKEHYSELGKKFGITIGEIFTDSIKVAT